MNRLLPVTLVGGFLGAGKTSLLHHFVSHHAGGHLALFVESGARPNLDARALRGLCGAMRRKLDFVAEIPAGDEEAQLAWTARQLQECAALGRFERVLIETGGLTNATRWARHFGVLPGQARTLAAHGELQQVVCVVDALDFDRDIVQPARSRPPDFLLDFEYAQIEGATRLVLNKCDLMEDAEREACTRLLRIINPDALIIETAYGEVPPEELTRPASVAQLERRLVPPAPRPPVPDEAALTSSVLRVHRPFHPERFWRWFNAEHAGLLRVKGLVWLATRNLLVGGISRTRRQNACGTAGIWWAALPREEWPTEPDALARMQADWREPYGDRRQEIVLIGDAAAMGAIMRGLQACLLTDAEMAQPVESWVRWPDPFPEWDLEGE